MLDELERYPDLDTTEALVRVASQNLMTALTSKKNEDWSAEICIRDSHSAMACFMALLVASVMPSASSMFSTDVYKRQAR